MLSTLIYILRVLILEISVPVFDIGSDFYNGYLYYLHGDSWWGSFTLLFVFLPGIMEMLYWVIKWINHSTHQNKRDLLKYSLFFGPITFPFGTVIWHLVTMIPRGRGKV